MFSSTFYKNKFLLSSKYNIYNIYTIYIGDWWGNFIGDICWTIEPALILTNTMIISYFKENLNQSSTTAIEPDGNSTNTTTTTSNNNTNSNTKKKR